MGISVCIYPYWKDTKAQNIPMLLKRSAKKKEKKKEREKKSLLVYLKFGEFFFISISI